MDMWDKLNYLGMFLFLFVGMIFFILYYLKKQQENNNKNIQ